MSANGKFVPDPGWPSIIELAIERWGQPNKRLSKPDDIRFGAKGSKSVKPSANTWFDHESNEGSGYVEMHHATRGELPKQKANGKVPPWQDIGTTYPYHDAGGDLILEVVRTRSREPRFRQRQPNGRGGWSWSVKHIPGHDCLLYRLPDLRASGDAIVWITEGEKDCDRLRDAGLIATTNIGGAGKWRDECAEEFRGKHCVVLQDNDDAGRAHASTVSRSLIGVAASVKVLLLPGLLPKGDVSDWLDTGKSINELERLGREASEEHFSDAELDSGGPAQDGELRPDPDGQPAELPVIICAAGQLPRMVVEAEAALLTAAAPIYQRTMLVRPTEVEYDAAPPSGSKEPRKTHSTALVAVTAPALTKMLSRAAIFMKWNERKKQNVVCDPPSKLVDIILASRGEWTFPVVRGVLTTPTLRPDGSVLKTPGYDPISRYYLTFPSNLVLPDIPETPTREQAAESLQRLDRLLDGYAFADETGVFRAVALAMLMTQVLRCAMPVSPLQAVSATAPGTGKSHLVDLASTIAVGRPCPIINAGKNDEETEKGINTKLISGIPGFSIDNVQRELSLEALNTATERPLLSPRKFGVLEDIEVENGVVIYMTGNNLAIIDEQVRRTVLCKMDANVEQPEQRAFDTDPIAIVLADRGRYIADVLTIVRAYITNGNRPNIPPYGSYPEWSRFVREPLVWLGQPDPLLSQNSARANDTALNQRRDIINAWHVAFGAGAHTLAEAASYATTVPGHGGYDPADTQAERDDKLAAYHAHRDAQQQLLAAMRAAFPSGRDGIDTIKLGYWMRRFAGRMTDGLKFVTDGVTAGTARWRLTQ